MTIKRQVFKGVKWTASSTIILAVVSILKVSILTRYLNKSDFGLMALVMFVMGFMELFNDMGLTSAILHKQDISKQQYSSLYWVNWLGSLLMYFVVLLISPLVAEFYKQSLLRNLIPLLGINLLLSGIGRQFKTIEQKNLLFNVISKIDILSSLFSLVLSVILARKGFGVYALVYPLLFQSLCSNLLYLFVGLKKYGLLFHFKFSETRFFLNIGIYQVGGQFINYFNRDLDIVLIGKFFSPAILGGYSLAKQLVFRPVQLINPILISVATPTLALFQKDVSILKKNYLKLLNIVSSINLPVYLAIIIFAPFIIGILYGTQFHDIVPLVRILSVYMIFRAIGNPVGSLVVATGRTDLELFWSFLTLIIMPGFIYVGSQFSIEGVTIAITLAMIILYFPSWKFLIYKLTKATFKEYLLASFIINFGFLKLPLKAMKKQIAG